MFKTYLKAVALGVLVLGSFGMVLPYLISAPSDIAVVGGLSYLLVVFPYATLKLLQSIKKDILK
jgi:hypothetical protein